MPDEKKIIRTFFGIKIESAVLGNIVTLQKNAKKAFMENQDAFRWNKSINLHVTLFFIGDTPVEKLDEIDKALKKIVSESSLKPFDLSFSGLGFFPEIKRPRVYWAGVDKNQELLSLQKSIKNEMLKIGLEDDGRIYNPHVTLCRLKALNKREWNHFYQFIEDHRKIKNGTLKVSEIHLYESQLTTDGSHYLPKITYKLDGF